MQRVHAVVLGQQRVWVLWGSPPMHSIGAVAASYPLLKHRDGGREAACEGGTERKRKKYSGVQKHTGGTTMEGRVDREFKGNKDTKRSGQLIFSSEHQI